MKNLIIVLMILFSSVLIYGQNIEKDMYAIVNGNNKFAIDMYHQIKQIKDTFVFSSLSISSAVGMTYTGSRASTRDEIRMVFEFPSDNKDTFNGFKKFFNRISEINNDNHTELTSANSIWLEKKYHFLPEYKTGLIKNFGAEVREVDFISRSAQAAREINQWVAVKTKNKIENIINGTPGPATALILVNTVYFKGMWRSPFRERHTGKKSFWLDQEKKVLVDFMFKTSEHRYGENKFFKLLELNYRSRGLSMIILLPAKKNGLAETEKNLSIENLKTWLKEMRGERVEVGIPKFKFRSKYDLISCLKRAGIYKAFTWPGADLSGIDGTNMLYISKVLHETFIEVDEAGTEAAAATVELATMGYEGPSQNRQVKIFNANQPFIYLIRENDTGAILFLGRVMNPGDTK